MGFMDKAKKMAEQAQSQAGRGPEAVQRRARAPRRRRRGPVTAVRQARAPGARRPTPAPPAPVRASGAPDAQPHGDPLGARAAAASARGAGRRPLPAAPPAPPSPARRHRRPASDPSAPTSTRRRSSPAGIRWPADAALRVILKGDGSRSKASTRRWSRRSAPTAASTTRPAIALARHLLDARLARARRLRHHRRGEHDDRRGARRLRAHDRLRARRRGARSSPARAPTTPATPRTSPRRSSTRARRPSCPSRPTTTSPTGAA